MNPELGLVAGFGAFGVLFAVMFCLVVVVIVVKVVQGGAQWQQNNNSPVLTLPAVVVTKRQDTSGGMDDMGPTTNYFVTFQLHTGERLELPVPGRQFGQLAEGDQGQLTHQGTRFKEFTRAIAPTAPQPGGPQDSPLDSPRD